MTDFELQAFQGLMAATSVEAFQALTVRTPVVLAESLWAEFQQWLGKQPAQAQAAGARVLQVLPIVLKDTVERWKQVPFGGGPLDEILRRRMTGEIDEYQAALLAGTTEVARNLSAAHVRARMMQFATQAMNGDWRPAILSQQVILAAIAARRAMFTREQKAMEAIGAIQYSYAVIRAVWETADGRYLSDTVARLHEVASQDLTPWHSPGAAEYVLGSLHLDSYIWKRTSANFKLQMDEWMRRPMESMGVKFTAEMAKQTALPSPLEAFTIAAKHYMASANLETGAARGKSLKGYMEAEVWKKFAGGQTASLAAVAAEAQSLLVEERYAEVRAAVARLLEGSGQTEDVGPWREQGQALLATETGELVQKYGWVDATELLKRVMETVQKADPALALALWRKALPLISQLDDGEAIEGYLQNGLLFIITALADQQMAAKDVLGKAKAAGWTEEKVVGTLLFLASESQASRNELQGVELVKAAAGASAQLAIEWGTLYKWLTAVLYRGEGSNQFKANDYSQAMKAYALSTLCFLDGWLPESARKTMELGADLVSRQAERVDDFVSYFSIVMADLERQGGPEVVARMRELGRQFFPLTIKKDGTNSSSFDFAGILKGVLFGAARQASGQLDWLESEQARTMRERIADCRKAAPGGGMVRDIGGLTMDDLLTVFLEDSELAGGEGPDATLHNLEVRFDRELGRQMGKRRPKDLEWRPTVPAVQSELGPETVLIDYYSGNLPNGNAGLYLHILTHETVIAGTLDLHFPGAQVLLGKLEFPADLLAVGVAGARIEVQKEPAAGTDVSEEGRQAMAGTLSVKGSVEQILSKLRQQGKWHLCIAPCGPAHVFPFHLLPYGQGLLSDEWAVTYLPTMRMLEPVEGQAQTRARKMASFGIDFKGGQPHGLPEILGAEEEAANVAKIFGEAGLVGAAASENALHEALKNAQRIHISTHGLLTVSAPSFQRVYLAPDQENDGILFAWELLAHDLRGVDLLTLSACETALGRVDKGDNVRGFAANALIAGVNTVIGTLWPVRTDVTKLFFETFYGEILKESGKREAFQTAQLTTREKYPQYCHWGAFWFTGRW